jgi:hypothetical protein
MPDSKNGSPVLSFCHLCPFFEQKTKHFRVDKTLHIVGGMCLAMCVSKRRDTALLDDRQLIFLACWIVAVLRTCWSLSLESTISSDRHKFRKSRAFESVVNVSFTSWLGPAVPLNWYFCPPGSLWSTWHQQRNRSDDDTRCRHYHSIHSNYPTSLHCRSTKMDHHLNFYHFWKSNPAHLYPLRNSKPAHYLIIQQYLRADACTLLAATPFLQNFLTYSLFWGARPSLFRCCAGYGAPSAIYRIPLESIWNRLSGNVR